jgi:hypothetical protein
MASDTFVGVATWPTLIITGCSTRVIICLMKNAFVQLDQFASNP